MKHAYTILLGSLKIRRHSEDISVNERIILKWILWIKVPVVARSQSLALSAPAPDCGFESCLEHGCMSLVSVCCVVLCKEVFCDVLITHPGRPTVCRKID
jgi:hypothetical protein